MHIINVSYQFKLNCKVFIKSQRFSEQRAKMFFFVLLFVPVAHTQSLIVENSQYNALIKLFDSLGAFSLARSIDENFLLTAPLHRLPVTHLSTRR